MGSFLVCHPLLASHPKTALPQSGRHTDVVIKWATFNSLIVRPKSARNSSRWTKVALDLSAFSACAAGLIARGQRRSQKAQPISSFLWKNVRLLAKYQVRMVDLVRPEFTINIGLFSGSTEDSISSWELITIVVICRSRTELHGLRTHSDKECPTFSLSTASLFFQQNYVIRT
jgi:hypothetical protein